MNFRETYWQRLTIQSNLFGDYLPSSHIYCEVRKNLHCLLKCVKLFKLFITVRAISHKDIIECTLVSGARHQM